MCSLLAGNSEQNEQTQPQEVMVYICDSPWAECYHKTKDCEGLDMCTHKIDSMPISKAKQHYYRPCRFCYGY